MNWQPTDVLIALAALVVAILVVRYAKVIVKTVMFLGGLLFLAIAAVVLALAMGWWQPTLPTALELLRTVIR